MIPKSDEIKIVEHLIEVARPVGLELFLFAYNVFSDPTYIHLKEDGPGKISIHLNGVGELKIAENSNNVRLMSVWNDLIDLEISEEVRLATVLRLMQIGQVFLHQEVLGDWLTVVEGNSVAGIDDSLVKACATVNFVAFTGFGLSYDIDNLYLLARMIDKIDHPEIEG